MLQNHEDKNMLIYPNPNNGIFSVKTDSKIFTLLEIFDLGGRKLYSQKVSENNLTQIKLDQFQRGVYTIKLSNDQEQLIDKLIISE